MNGTSETPPGEELPISPARLLEESPNGWLLADSEGRIQFANARASELFGYTRAELLGQAIEVLVPERYREGHTKHRARFMEHPAVRPMGLGMELAARRQDGSEFPVEISLSPLHTDQGMYVTAIVRDISERKRLEDEHNRLRVELEMERERDRIGMDLHDGIMQEVYAAGLTLELALGDVREDPDAAEAEIESSIEQLHSVIRNIRSYIFDLRPREYGGSLFGALTELAHEFRENAQIEVRDEVPEFDAVLEEQGASAAYHIVHEALSNVRKHADASLVSLTVQRSNGHIVIEVKDNGRGFDMGTEVSQVHRGLRNMSARAKEAGCRLELQSMPGEGTCIAIRVPVAG